MWWGYYEWGGKRFVGTEDNWSFGYSMADPRVKNLLLNSFFPFIMEKENRLLSPTHNIRSP